MGSLKQPTLSHLVNEAPRNVQLAQRQLVVVPVVQHVEQVCIEGVDVVHLWELIQDDAQPLVPVGLSVLYLQGAKAVLVCYAGSWAVCIVLCG